MAIFSLALCLGLATVCEATVPLFAWSDHTYFLSKGSSHNSVTEFIDHADFTNALSASQSALSSYIQVTDDAPEAILAFVVPKMSSGQLASKTALKTQATSSASSLSVSYAKPHDIASFTEQLRDAVDGRSILTSCDQLDTIDRSIFSSGATDLVQVMDSNPDAACVDAATLIVSEGTQGRYIGVFTANTDNNDAFLVQATSLTATNSTGESVEYVTPDILFALIVSIPFVFLVVGACLAAMAIEAPPRMSKAMLAPTKEY